MRTSRAAGFTLMEVLIIVAVIAVLAAVAIPNYSQYVLRTKRATARQVLMEGSQYLERIYTVSGCYDFADTASCVARSGSATVIPATLTRAPAEGRISYAVSWQFTNSGQAYTLTAVPCGAGGSCPAGADAGFVDPDCGSLTLNQTGLKSMTAAGASLSTCWQR